MHNGRKTNMNTRQPRSAAAFAGRSKWSSNAARPEQNGSHNAQRNYERYLALAQAEAQSGNTVGAGRRRGKECRNGCCTVQSISAT